MSVLRLQLRGPVTLLDANGTEFTPAGRKSCAILVLLATSPGKRRARRWLESMLWSQRSAEQAQSSLRQSLVEIRRSLAEHQAALQSDRYEVWLDEDILSITHEHDTSQQLEIAEGLVTKDPAFDNWLSSYQQQAPVQQQVTSNTDPVVFLNNDALAGNDRFFGECLNNQIARNLSHSIDLQTRVPLAQEDIYVGKSNSLLLRTDVMSHDGIAYVTLKLISLNDGSIVWSEQVRTGAQPENFFNSFQIYSTALKASDEVSRALAAATEHSRGDRHIQSLIYRAIGHIFSFEKSRLLTAEKLLDTAASIKPSPVISGWKCFLYLIMVIEGVARSTDDAIASSRFLAQATVHEYPDNAQILALVSQVELYLFDNIDTAARLAHDSLAINPGSPMAILSLADTELRLNDLQQSRQYAYNALEVVARSPHRHWWHLTCCFVDISLGDYKNAIKNAESALAYAPNFRAPLRHLYALYLHERNYVKATELAHRLIKVDPGFSLKSVRENDAYPADLLRKTGLVEMKDVPLINSTEDNTCH